MSSIVIIAHNIRSTYNVGSIFRSSEGFGVDHLYFTGYTPYPATLRDERPPHIRNKLSSQIAKTALGAERIVSFTHTDSPELLIENYRKQGYTIAALEQAKGSVVLSKYHPPEKLLLLLGEEVHGIPVNLLELCDVILEIPMIGKKESFNVSVATGIALYALSA